MDRFSTGLVWSTTWRLTRENARYRYAVANPPYDTLPCWVTKNKQWRLMNTVSCHLLFFALNLQAKVLQSLGMTNYSEEMGLLTSTEACFNEVVPCRHTMYGICSSFGWRTYLNKTPQKTKTNKHKFAPPHPLLWAPNKNLNKVTPPASGGPTRGGGAGRFGAADTWRRKEPFNNRSLVETSFEVPKALFFKAFRSLKIALTEARVLKHDLSCVGRLDVRGPDSATCRCPAQRLGYTRNAKQHASVSIIYKRITKCKRIRSVMGGFQSLEGSAGGFHGPSKMFTFMCPLLRRESQTTIWKPQFRDLWHEKPQHQRHDRAWWLYCRHACVGELSKHVTLVKHWWRDNHMQSPSDFGNLLDVLHHSKTRLESECHNKN